MTVTWSKGKVWKNHKKVADRQPPTVVRKESKKKIPLLPYSAVGARSTYYKYKVYIDKIYRCGSVITDTQSVIEIWYNK